MHLRLRELAIPSNPPIYPLINIKGTDQVGTFMSLKCVV